MKDSACAFEKFFFKKFSFSFFFSSFSSFLCCCCCCSSCLSVCVRMANFGFDDLDDLLDGLNDQLAGLDSVWSHSFHSIIHFFHFSFFIFHFFLCSIDSTPPLKCQWANQRNGGFFKKKKISWRVWLERERFRDYFLGSTYYISWKSFPFFSFLFSFYAPQLLSCCSINS